MRQVAETPCFHVVRNLFHGKGVAKWMSFIKLFLSRNLSWGRGLSPLGDHFTSSNGRLQGSPLHLTHKVSHFPTITRLPEWQYV